MDAAIKAKWVEALRSGKYQQAQEFLKVQVTPDMCSFCCLGVLQEVLAADGVVIGKDEDGELLDLDEATERLGLTEKQQLDVSNMNDDGYPFDRIADHIERHL
jgi:hypothetical protein